MVQVQGGGATDGPGTRERGNGWSLVLYLGNP